MPEIIPTADLAKSLTVSLTNLKNAAQNPGALTIDQGKMLSDDLGLISAALNDYIRLKNNEEAALKGEVPASITDIVTSEEPSVDNTEDNTSDEKGTS